LVGAAGARLHGGGEGLVRRPVVENPALQFGQVGACRYAGGRVVLRIHRGLLAIRLARRTRGRERAPAVPPRLTARWTVRSLVGCDGPIPSGSTRAARALSSGGSPVIAGSVPVCQ